MLKTLSEILESAEKGRYAVIAPDFPSLYFCRILLDVAEETQTPIILSYSTGFKPILDVRSYAHFVRILREEIEQSSVPAALHLDHATEISDIKEAIDLGYTSVMIDASFEPFEANLERTRRVVDMAHPAGVSVEAEIGHVSSSTGYLQDDPFAGFLTIPEEAVQFAAETNVDALAVAIGTVHGPVRGQPKLDYELLAKLNKLIDIPLVLHGSSGLNEDAISRTVELGIRKVNVYSDIIVNALKASFDELSVQQINPNRLGEVQANAIRKVIESNFRVSGSLGAAREV